MNYIEEETSIVFQELPDHISLTFSITGCGHHCKGCHSPHLQDAANGDKLTIEILTYYLDTYKEIISAVIFFGGCLYPKELIECLELIHSYGIKIALYTGFADVSKEIKDNLDYLKVGSYKEELGPLSSPTTNQRLYDLSTGEDITYKFNRKVEASNWD